MNKIDINRLKYFNRSLANLRDDTKDMKVSISSLECLTPNCFNRLIGIVANSINELILCYKYDINTNAPDYHGYAWSSALSIFLGFDDEFGLESWVDENPELWGCSHEKKMSEHETAFSPSTDIDIKPTLTHRDLIAWWAQVEKNVTGE